MERYELSANEINVLIIHESKPKSELIINALSHAGYKVEAFCVHQPEKLKGALNEQQFFDAVIFGYPMQKLPLLEVLELNKKHCMSTPLIVISKELQIEDAVEMMQAGCSDVILEDNLLKLSNSVNQQIAISKAHRCNEMNEQKSCRYQLLAENTQEAILFIDQFGRIIDANLGAEKIYGYPQNEICGMTLCDLRRTKNKTKELQQLNNASQKGTTYEAMHYGKNQFPIYVELSTSSTQLDGKKVYINIIRDVTARKKIEDENRYLSYHDYLTGIFNRRFFEEEMQRLDTKRNLPISIIIGDVNGLKLLNDTFGHYEGDQLILKASQAIQGACRADDIVARWGGDEFAVLLPKTTPQIAEQIVERIKLYCKNEQCEKDIICVNISFGIATKTNSEESLKEVLTQAETVMYKDKIAESRVIKENLLQSVKRMLNQRTPQEEMHSKRVSEWCARIGECMGFDGDHLEQIKLTGLLHDIGKVAIEKDILDKPGGLTSSEWKEIKRHPEIGFRILKSASALSAVAECILGHHERIDGLGYPKGIKGEEISVEAKIVSIADAYDAMTSERCYCHALSKEEAIEELKKNAGTQFEKEIVNIFIEKVLA